MRQTVKVLTLKACSDALELSGFTADDENFYVPKLTQRNKKDYKDTMYSMSFVEQRAKLKCCQRICRYVMWIDLLLQAHLHKIIQNQITIFKVDVSKHFKYIPNDDLLNDTNVQTMLEGERTSEDPKVLINKQYSF